MLRLGHNAGVNVICLTLGDGWGFSPVWYFLVLNIVWYSRFCNEFVPQGWGIGMGCFGPPRGPRSAIHKQVSLDAGLAPGLAGDLREKILVPGGVALARLVKS